MMSFDDEDDGYIRITGSHAGFSTKDGYQRDLVRPKYSVQIRQDDGSWGQPIPYQATPYFLVLGVLGNLSDLIASKTIEDSDKANYLTATLGYTTLSLYDAVPMDGIFNLAEAWADFRDPNGKNKGVKLAEAAFKAAVSVVTTPVIPNLTKQAAKAMDPRLWQPSTIKEIAYKAGGATASDNNSIIDHFGREVKRYPGENFLPISHWTNEVGKDPADIFLVSRNIFPKGLNQDMLYIKNYFEPDINKLEIGQLSDDPKLLRQMKMISGKYAHDYIVDNLPELQKIKSDKFLKETIQDIFKDQQAYTLKQIQEGTKISSKYRNTILSGEDKFDVREKKNSLDKKINLRKSR